MEIFDFGLQLALVLFAYAPAKDHRQLVGSAEVTMGVQQSFAQFVQSRTAAENQVLTILDLGEE